MIPQGCYQTFFKKLNDQLEKRPGGVKSGGARSSASGTTTTTGCRELRKVPFKLFMSKGSPIQNDLSGHLPLSHSVLTTLSRLRVIVFSTSSSWTRTLLIFGSECYISF